MNYFVVREAVKSYKELFDEKIENSTFVVLVIGWLIVLVGLFIPNAHSSSSYIKSSISDISTLEYIGENQNTIIINGEEYIVYITKK